MTATTGPPSKEGRRRRRRLRFSSMETLGFSNPSSTWSDTPTPLIAPRHGRHERPANDGESVADWEPKEIGARLNGGDFRWSILLLTVLLAGGMAATAYWIYQRPDPDAGQALVTVKAEAGNLRDGLPALEAFNDALLGEGDGNDSDLGPLDDAARRLFEAAGDLTGNDSVLRAAADTASSATLDAVRLTTSAGSYVVAVAPILQAPELETDPQLIELDEAARSFGSWQLHFDEVRTALPDGVLSDATQELDILSGDLAGFLTSYMDALRADDAVAAQTAVGELSQRLDQVRREMVSAAKEVQKRVDDRIAETRRALETVLGRP